MWAFFCGLYVQELLPVDDDFAELFAGFESFVGLGALVGFEDLIDDWFERAGVEEGDDFFELVVGAHC